MLKTIINKNLLGMVQAMPPFTMTILLGRKEKEHELDVLCESLITIGKGNYISLRFIFILLVCVCCLHVWMCTECIPGTCGSQKR